ncbi:MAG: hypothetical protein V1773_14655 [bacterium]
MYCNNKNHLLDLIYNEGNEVYLKDIRRHVDSCKICTKNILELKATLNILDLLPWEKPSANLFENVLKEVNNIVPSVEINRSSNSVIPIIQILFGLVFVFTIIYLISVKLSLSPLWDVIKNNWFAQSFGSTGIAVVAVLLIGSFFALSISPILYLSSQQNKKFN